MAKFNDSVFDHDGRPVRDIPGEAHDLWDKHIAQTPQAYRSATVHFSRKIGAGALKIAHRLAKRIGYAVVDKEILEDIARDAQLSVQALTRFDERHAGKLAEFDLVINADHIKNSSCAASIIEEAFRKKFAGKIDPI